MARLLPSHWGPWPGWALGREKGGEQDPAPTKSCVYHVPGTLLDSLQMWAHLIFIMSVQRVPLFPSLMKVKSKLKWPPPPPPARSHSDPYGTATPSLQLCLPKATGIRSAWMPSRDVRAPSSLMLRHMLGRKSSPSPKGDIHFVTDPGCCFSCFTLLRPFGHFCGINDQWQRYPRRKT